MRSDLASDLVPAGSLSNSVDEFAARRLVNFANRRSRRSFLALVGRSTLALMGGTFIGLWRSEGAWAACGGESGPTPRASCMCTGLIGNNNCPQCCGGFWRSCITNRSDPASCWNTNCQPGKTKYFEVKLYDCCNDCSQGCSTVNCGGESKQTCCQTGYCSEGGCGNKRVRCVRKVCTDIVCRNCA